MKHFSRLFIGCLLVVWIAACDTEDRPALDPEEIPDQGAVYDAIHDQLWRTRKKPYGAKFTDGELATVTHLRVDYAFPWRLFDDDFSLLARCINLKELWIEDMMIEDEQLRGLVGLTALEKLTLEVTGISDISPLAGLVNLRWLMLMRNNIHDIGPLAGLINLQVLDLSHNRIAAITPLKRLIQLQEVYLDNNRIVDLKPLVDNPGLSGENLVPIDPGFNLKADLVSVGSNLLSEVSINQHIPALEARGVIVLR